MLDWIIASVCIALAFAVASIFPGYNLIIAAVFVVLGLGFGKFLERLRTEPNG